MWAEYELSIFEVDEWLLIEYMGVALSLSLSLSLSHTPPLSCSLSYLCMWQTHFAHRRSWPATSFPLVGPELLAHRHSTSKLISGLVQTIKRCVSEVLALLTCVMWPTAVHGGWWHWHWQSAQRERVCVHMCEFATLLKTRLDTLIAVKQDSLAPSGPKCEISFHNLDQYTAHA